MPNTFLFGFIYLKLKQIIKNIANIEDGRKKSHGPSQANTDKYIKNLE